MPSCLCFSGLKKGLNENENMNVPGLAEEDFIAYMRAKTAKDI